MKRKIMDRLVVWMKKTRERKPLLLYGARQVGKTYILTSFAEKYFDNILYLNFEQTPALKSIFDGDLSPERIISLLESYFSLKVSKEKTLIFFDEIQNCERALVSLKYFAENANDYYVVAAGSLLGVAVNRETQSFPVGKVQIETLHPLDFEEFLWALNKKQLVDVIKDCFQTNEKMIQLFHEQALELLNIYLLIGGMPAVVLDYSNEKSFINASKTQSNILTAYLADMAKYTTATEAVKVRTAFESIPAQLAKENKKFQYKLLKKGASASHFGVALDWLASAGIVYKCARVSHGLVPLSGYLDLSAFKLYMADIGLLAQNAGITMESLLVIDQKQSIFKGAIIENYVAQALCSNGYPIHYWESQSIAEVDFVVNINGLPIPIEVKSSINVKSRSLSVYVAKYKPAYSIRVSSRNFGLENNIKAVPLYAAFMI